MQTTQNGDNTQRVISNHKLIGVSVKPKMPRKKKIAIGVITFIILAAIAGTVIGLYYYFAPGSNHIFTTVSTTNDDETYSSTEFDYFDRNMVGDSVNQRFTLMVAGLNGSQTLLGKTLKRNLQTINQTLILDPSDPPVPDDPILDYDSNSDSANTINVDVTLHYNHESGIKIKFRGNEVLKISVPIDKVVEYIAQQEDQAENTRLLQDLTQYEGEDQAIQGQQIFDNYRSEVLAAIQQIYNNTGINIDMADLDIYELDYDENSGSYQYTNASLTDTRRRLWSFRHLFHKIGHFVKKTASDAVHLIKKDGPKILKYGAIAALAGIDIAAKGPSGISDAVKMFKSRNVLTALEMTAEGVATRLPPYLSIPIEFVGAACFSHPPKMHCTKAAAENAVKQDVIGYVKKHAISTVLSLLE